MYRVGVDLGGTNIVAGVINEKMEIIGKGKLKTNCPRDAADILEDVAKAVEAAVIDAGITMNDVDPDYVIIGEGNSYNYENILRAVRLVLKGAKLIGTNSDLTGPSEDGIIPACRAMIAPIEMATGQNAYFVGKPNPLMMRTGLRILGVHSEDAVMIGDRMDTDMVAGIETGLDTVLVLSGVTRREDIAKFPYRPRLVLDGVGDIPGPAAE